MIRSSNQQHTSLLSPFTESVCSERPVGVKKWRRSRSDFFAAVFSRTCSRVSNRHIADVTFTKRPRSGNSEAVLVQLSAERMNYGRVAPASWRTSHKRKSDKEPCCYINLEVRLGPKMRLEWYFWNFLQPCLTSVTFFLWVRPLLLTTTSTKTTIIIIIIFIFISSI